MTVTLDQFQRGVHNYVETEVALKASGLTRFGVYLILPSIHDIINSYYENPLMMCFHEDDGVDIDKLKRQAIEAFDHCNTVDVAGFKFDKRDVELLYDYVMRS